MSKHSGRHTPAFLLLFLDQSPAYGASLLTKMKSELPYCFSDSAIVYRCLQEMEKDGLVEIKWETEGSGQPRKWYFITEKGKAALAEYAEDICKRRANLEYFLIHYQSDGENKS